VIPKWLLYVQEVFHFLNSSEYGRLFSKATIAEHVLEAAEI
jgi:hypothetical protein